jgi:flavin reductase (DIM6/NTAB) family NADH-FMN oxidoreductase RutF
MPRCDLRSGPCQRGGSAVSKILVEYGSHIEETTKAFSEGRVLLVSSGKEGLPNVMAIGWGLAGTIWKKPVFLVLVRPSRYTYKLIEETGEFTVNVVSPELKEAATYCGTVSGRDHDKFKEKGLTQIPSLKVRTPIIKEGVLHFECRVVYKSDLIPSELEKDIISSAYPQGDFHRTYFGEILACRHEQP